MSPLAVAFHTYYKWTFGSEIRFNSKCPFQYPIGTIQLAPYQSYNSWQNMPIRVRPRWKKHCPVQSGCQKNEVTIVQRLKIYYADIRKLYTFDASLEFVSMIFSRFRTL